MSVASGAGTACNDEIREIFERWETRITELEFAGECEVGADPLEAGYLESEELNELRTELEELRGGTA